MRHTVSSLYPNVAYFSRTMGLRARRTKFLQPWGYTIDLARSRLNSYVRRTSLSVETNWPTDKDVRRTMAATEGRAKLSRLGGEVRT